MKYNPILGNAKGKIGDVVLYVKNGVQMGRKYQPNVFNPRTARQELSRAKLSLASSLANQFKRALEIGFGAYTSTRVSAYNLGVAEYVPVSSDIISGEDPNLLSVDFTSLIVAKGPLLSPQLSGTMSYTTPLTIQGTYMFPQGNWDNLKNGEALGIVVVAYCPDNKNIVTWQDVVTADGSHTFEVMVPAGWQGMKVHVYAFYKVLPAGVNGIETATTPWRFPSNASYSSYLGFGNIS